VLSALEATWGQNVWWNGVQRGGTRAPALLWVFGEVGIKAIELPLVFTDDQPAETHPDFIRAKAIFPEASFHVVADTTGQEPSNIHLQIDTISNGPARQDSKR
jgi:hypothetical protein